MAAMVRSSGRRIEFLGLSLGHPDYRKPSTLMNEIKDGLSQWYLDALATKHQLLQQFSQLLCEHCPYS